VEFTMLDDRQYRTDNPCGGGESLRCEEAVSGRYTMLGREQERWLADGFPRSRAQWNIVGQQLRIAELEHLPYEDERYWNDAWDGYPRARQRLLEEVVRTGLRYGPMVPYNPHIKYFEGDRRGYFKATITPSLLQLDLRFVSSVEDPAGTGYTEASFIVEEGMAGAQPA
jgi:alkaline phosphatase D